MERVSFLMRVLPGQRQATERQLEAHGAEIRADAEDWPSALE